ncbi:hypothetical protein [Alkalibacillus aidingensis]|uniref:hypothetical protein n=1 Tax=Alkalibacillus aidingensis TaxID=2747607 RepID=UPI0016601F18|nr:hypothetical protein [Alkalibacillus aidingensis]
MTQGFYGVLLLLFLFAPPVRDFLESIMILHMHMQMPMIIIAGFLIGDYLIKKFPNFFSKWNENGIPGAVLLVFVTLYWMIPKTMDDALISYTWEVFKFISLAFLVGVPLRDSWKRLSDRVKDIVIIIFVFSFILMGALYIFSEQQLCNNYLQVEQLTLGWGFITMGICGIIYLIQEWFIDSSKYE